MTPPAQKRRRRPPKCVIRLGTGLHRRAVADLGLATQVLAKQGPALRAAFAFAAERSLGGAAATFLALMLLGRSMRLEAPWQTLLIGVVQTGGFIRLADLGAGRRRCRQNGGAGIFTMPIWTLLMVFPPRNAPAQWLAGSHHAGRFGADHRALEHGHQPVKQSPWRGGGRFLGNRHHPDQTVTGASKVDFAVADGVADAVRRAGLGAGGRSSGRTADALDAGLHSDPGLYRHH